MSTEIEPEIVVELVNLDDLRASIDGLSGEDRFWAVEAWCRIQDGLEFARPDHPHSMDRTKRSVPRVEPQRRIASPWFRHVIAQRTGELTPGRPVDAGPVMMFWLSELENLQELTTWLARDAPSRPLRRYFRDVGVIWAAYRRDLDVRAAGKL